MHALLFILIAIITSIIGNSMLTHIEVEEVLKSMPYFALLMGGVIVPTWNLKFKLSELREKENYSSSERRRLNSIIDKRLKTLTIYLLFFVATTVLLGASPLISNIPILITPTAIILLIMISESIYFLVTVITGYSEIDGFRKKLADKNSRNLEKQRLLAKLNQGNSHD